MKLLVASTYKEARQYYDSLPLEERKSISIFTDIRQLHGLEQGTEVLLYSWPIEGSAKLDDLIRARQLKLTIV